MRNFFRIVLFAALFFAAALPSALMGQASCISANAGPDNTICSGSCANLVANISGTKGTNIYYSTPVAYTPFSFTGGNPVLVNLDDVWSPAINIPFCFDFYGTTYNQLVIGTNGVVSFNVSQALGNCPWTINTAAPNVALPLNCIMAPYQDIDPTIVTTSGATSINWNVYGTAPCRSFVINWNDVGMYGVGCDGLTSTSQVVLHESTNIIDIYIDHKVSCASWNNGAAIEGLQNASGTFATIVPGRNYPNVWTTPNDAIEFRPGGVPSYAVTWTDFANNIIGTSPVTQVCPTVTTSYIMNFTNSSCNGNPISYTDTVTITVIPSNFTTSDSVIFPTCQNPCSGSITIYPSGGVAPYTYSWSPNLGNGPVLTGLCSGTYQCTVTDANGCTSAISVNLNIPPPFTVLPSTTPTICNDSTGTASVIVSGGNAPFTFLWSTGDTTTSISGLMAGPYFVIITDSSGCPDTTTVTITTISLSVAQQGSSLLCNGDCNGTASVTVLSGLAPYTYSWAPFGGTTPNAINLCSGNYVCTVTDSLGCHGSATVAIVSPPPIILTPSANQTICLGQSAVVAASVAGGIPPYVYAWNNGLLPVSSNPITPTQTTIYTVQVTDSNGCSSSPQSTLVKVNGAPTANFTSTTGACPPIQIDFTNLTDTAVSYLWNFGDPSSNSANTSTLFSPSHIYQSGGSYTVTLIAVNAYGCSDTIALSNFSIPNAPNAGITIPSTLITTDNPVAVLSNTSTNAISYEVFFGDGDSLITTSVGPYTHTYDTLGTFTITLIAWSSDGCPDTARLILNVEDPTTCFIPNAFTPNGDGNNDIFMVYGINIENFQLLIFNRWGELIFQSNDVYDGWNGKYHDLPVQEDVYVWKLTYLDNYGNIQKRIGHVALVR